MDAPRGGFEGHLDICLKAEAGQVSDVTITSTRPLNAARVLIGRPVAEGLSLLSRIFSLCGMAQSVAGVGAVETALGISASPSQHAARQIMVDAEALEQTVLRMGLDWPRLTGVAPNVQALTGVRGAISLLNQTLFPDGNPAVPGGTHHLHGVALPALLDRLEIALNRFLLDADEISISTAFGDLAQFNQWVDAAATPVAASIGAITKEKFTEFNNSRIEIGYETGAFVRQSDHKLVTSLVADFGVGLLPRLVARLVELSDQPRRLRDFANMIQKEKRQDTPTDGSGVGSFELETARGRLRHSVEVEKGIITAYDVDAPTELNFAPEGPLRSMLVGADVINESTLLRHATLLVLALDPCVAFDVRLEGNGHA